MEERVVARVPVEDHDLRAMLVKGHGQVVTAIGRMGLLLSEHLDHPEDRIRQVTSPGPDRIAVAWSRAAGAEAASAAVQQAVSSLRFTRDPDDGQVAVEVMVDGHVQGVWFRASLQQEASGRGLVGWCRNEADGSVRAWLEGPDTTVKRVIDWIVDGGPPKANVTDVRVRAQRRLDFGAFTIEH